MKKKANKRKKKTKKTKTQKTKKTKKRLKTKTETNDPSRSRESLSCWLANCPFIDCWRWPALESVADGVTNRSITWSYFGRPLHSFDRENLALFFSLSLSLSLSLSIFLCGARTESFSFFPTVVSFISLRSTRNTPPSDLSRVHSGCLLGCFLPSFHQMYRSFYWIGSIELGRFSISEWYSLDPTLPHDQVKPFAGWFRSV